MKLAKRIFLFVAVNILIVTTITVLTSVLGIQPYFTSRGIEFPSLIALCLLWGFGGAFISLALSRVMAKWMMGVTVFDPASNDPMERDLLDRVHHFARAAGLTVMPEVGVYEGEELNAFATGPTKNRSLVAVSTGLLARMDADEVDGVLAHEIAHIANGDMVTMTLVQGVVNAFVMALARVAGFFLGQLVDEEKRPAVQFVAVLVLELALGMLGMIVVAAFSRRREYAADFGGARLAGRERMIAALERLKANFDLPVEEEQTAPALASLKIASRKGGLLSLFSTHPDLDDRIARLRA